MTTRAKRLWKYLEDEAGWSVSPDAVACKDHEYSSGLGPYCSECGKKKTSNRAKRREVMAELESAIAYALGE